jgi:hypothetical protein
VVDQAESLREQADQVQDLLVRIGIQDSSGFVRPLLTSLERSLHRALEELLVFLAISFRDLRERVVRTGPQKVFTTAWLQSETC